MLELIAKAFESFGFLSWCLINCQLFILLERTEKTRLSMQFFSSLFSSFKAFTGPAGEFSGTGPTPPFLAERKGLKHMRFMHQERHPPPFKGLEQWICASAVCSVNQNTAFCPKSLCAKVWKYTCWSGGVWGRTKREWLGALWRVAQISVPSLKEDGTKAWSWNNRPWFSATIVWLYLSLKWLLIMAISSRNDSLVAVCSWATGRVLTLLHFPSLPGWNNSAESSPSNPVPLKNPTF